MRIRERESVMSRVVRLPARTRARERSKAAEYDVVKASEGKQPWSYQDSYGVLGLDLGGTSGLAWWHGTLQGSIKDTLVGGTFGFAQEGRGLSSPEAERTQAEAIAARWCDLSAEWTFAGVPLPHHHIAVEDFKLRGRPGSTARGGLASPRLAALVEGMLVRVAPAENWFRYEPGRSKSFATSDRLKAWGLWCRSAPHARDAAKQVAIHIATLLG